MTTEDTPAEGSDRLGRLISLATALNAEIEVLARDSGTQFVSLARTTRRNRLMIWGLAAGGLLDVLLTVVMAFVGSGVIRNNDRIDKLTSDLQAQQTESRRRALCPLYGVFLDSRSEAGRKNAPDPAKYDHAFEVIEEGYMVLGCDKFLQESGKNQW